MKSPLPIKIKASGLQVQKTVLRRKIEGGALTNVWELAFMLPGLGAMSLDDDFVVEVYDPTLPDAERKWVETRVGDLKKDLLDGKYGNKKTTDPLI